MHYQDFMLFVQLYRSIYNVQAKNTFLKINLEFYCELLFFRNTDKVIFRMSSFIYVKIDVLTLKSLYRFFVYFSQMYFYCRKSLVYSLVIHILRTGPKPTYDNIYIYTHDCRYENSDIAVYSPITVSLRQVQSSVSKKPMSKAF